MPIPKLKDGESEEDFMGRCMADSVMNEEYPDTDQRAAICNAQMKPKKMSFADLKDLLQTDYSEIEGLEIFNILPNAHGLKFTEKDLDEIIEMYEKYSDSDKPNIKVSHSAQQVLLKEMFNVNEVPYGEELPNLGYLKNFRIVDGKRIFADAERVPSVLLEPLFGGKLFKTFSPELIMNYNGTGKKYIKAASLTNNPSLKHISDVHMSSAPGYGGNLIIEGVKTMSDKAKETQDQNTDIKEVIEETSKGVLEKFSEKITGMLGNKEDKAPPADQKEEPASTTAETVSLSDYEELKKSVNDLKLKLVEKDNQQKNFSEQLATIKANTRKEHAETVCKAALLDGVPKTVIEHWKPVLMSDRGEETIMLSQEIDGEKIEAEKSINTFIEEFFKSYPNKVDFSEKTRTDFADPSDSKTKKVNQRVTELEQGGMSKHEAIMQAGREILGK